jgi:hypothetical protein
LIEFILLSESRLGFKYESIWQRIPSVEVREGGFVRLLWQALIARRGRKVIYHIRYLKSGKSAYLRYCIVFLLSSLGLFKVLWTCHNIEEHNFVNTDWNRKLRERLTERADGIIVLHKDLKLFFSEAIQDKITVACFGDMSSFINSQEEANIDFARTLVQWENGREGTTVLSVSAAKKSNLILGTAGVAASKVRGVFISPKVPAPVEYDAGKVLFYNEGFVRAEIGQLLGRRGVIGYVGHTNVSVPTSLYMFASFGVPVVGVDAKPIKSIIEDYEIGLVVSNPEQFAAACERIELEYERFSNNCERLLEQHSWEKSAEIHRKALQQL